MSRWIAEGFPSLLCLRAERFGRCMSVRGCFILRDSTARVSGVIGS